MNIFHEVEQITTFGNKSIKQGIDSSDIKFFVCCNNLNYKNGIMLNKNDKINGPKETLLYKRQLHDD